MGEPTLRTIVVTICTACLDGLGEECHTPGCALWMHRVDLPIDPSAYQVVDPFAVRVVRACLFTAAQYLPKVGAAALAEEPHRG